MSATIKKRICVFLMLLSIGSAIVLAMYLIKYFFLTIGAITSATAFGNGWGKLWETVKAEPLWLWPLLLNTFLFFPWLNAAGHFTSKEGEEWSRAARKVSDTTYPK